MKEKNKETVYLVWGWNGELWEDSYEWIDSIYRSKESAENRLKELQKKAKKDKYDASEYEITEKELLS